ncbi:MAG: DMT family transporter [Anaerolineales bacterium]|nr:DMT family transporter [Anaerolineales bacterium]
MTVQKVVGLLIGFAGVVVLMSKDIGASAGSILGQGAVILASAFYAGSSIYARKFTEDTPGIFRSMGPLVSATAVMWLASFFLEAPVKSPDQSIIWIALLWPDLGSVLLSVMVFYLIHEIGLTRTTMVTYLFPLGGVTLGVIFLQENANLGNRRLSRPHPRQAVLLLQIGVLKNRDRTSLRLYRHYRTPQCGQVYIAQRTASAKSCRRFAAPTTRKRQLGILTIENAWACFCGYARIHHARQTGWSS